MGEQMPDRIEVHGAAKPGVDYIEVPTQLEAQVAALQNERRGYMQRGLTDRVAQVTAEIDRLSGRTPAGPTGPAQLPLPDGVEDGKPDPSFTSSLDDDAPPFPGWVKDRGTGEWRAPRPKGRPPKQDA